VPNEWAHKVAQSIVMIMDPSGSGINVVAQERMRMYLLANKVLGTPAAIRIKGY
jgi:hypothetical protein